MNKETIRRRGAAAREERAPQAVPDQEAASLQGAAAGQGALPASCADRTSPRPPDSRAVDLEQIRSFFTADRFAMDAGAVIESAQRGRAVCSMVIEPRHLNAGGTVQGGAVFTLADFAFAVAANAGQPLTVSLSNQISFLRPAKGGRLIAEATCVASGRRTCFYRVVVSDDLGTAVAEMTVNGYIK